MCFAFLQLVPRRVLSARGFSNSIKAPNGNTAAFPVRVMILQLDRQEILITQQILQSHGGPVRIFSFLSERIKDGFATSRHPDCCKNTNLPNSDHLLMYFQSIPTGVFMMFMPKSSKRCCLQGHSFCGAAGVH